MRKQKKSSLHNGVFIVWGCGGTFVVSDLLNDLTIEVSRTHLAKCLSSCFKVDKRFCERVDIVI
jgi:hypothetical protein